MATRPASATFTNVSVDVLNAIKNEASINYKNYVPYATADADSIRAIGAVIMDNPALMNEFVNSLVNRIGKVIVSSKLYENPWNMFKKGVLELGETIEDIFVDLAKPHTFNPENAYAGEYKRELPNIRTAFYVLNYQKFYKQTTSREELKTAFLSWSGVTDLITKIITAMYTAANYDEFLTMKYMLATKLLAGQIRPTEVAAVSSANAKSIATAFKAVSNKIEFMSPDYNMAGVKTHTIKDDQYLIINAEFDALMDVEVLASAFNMSKAEFLGHRVLIDGFGTLDTDRLNELFAGDTTYRDISEDEMIALNAIPAVLVDRDFFQIYDNLLETGTKYVEEGLYWNNWLHKWSTFAVSPFAQATVFVPAAPAVTSVNVSPSVATAKAGSTVQLTANVDATNFAPTSVNWTSNTENVTVDERGIVTIGAGVLSETAITITATSTWNNGVTGTATITVA